MVQFTYPLKLQALGKLISYRHIASCVLRGKFGSCFSSRDAGEGSAAAVTRNKRGAPGGADGRLLEAWETCLFRPQTRPGWLHRSSFDAIFGFERTKKKTKLSPMESPRGEGTRRVGS